MVYRNDTSSKLSILNQQPSILEGPQLLHDLVRLSSDTPAIDFLENGTKRRKFSYKTLHTLSNALASRITQISAKLESASAVIPVLIPQCPELYVVLLAVLKCGKAFCPLLLDTPAERLNFMLQDISADFLITLSPYQETLRIKTDLYTIFADRELSEEIQTESTLPQASTHDLAYVLYTSGSTGLPKAVKVSHRAVTQSLLAHDRHMPHFARFLQFAAPTFDVSIFEIFFPWFRGRTLVGCSRVQLLDNLPMLINDLEVDAAELTPTVVSSLLHGRTSVPGLKLLLTIGEMLTQHVVEEFGGDDLRESILWAMYGPTEAAIHCTLQPRLSSQSTTATIGFPLDTVSTYIVAPFEDHSSTDVRILPMGEVGELVIGGPQVANGYLNRAELTASVFVDHPTYGRMYRTGDRARLRSDGCLECLGRVTVGQVKLRGQRVELGEIEQVIMRIDGCRTATALIIDDRLVAFCAVSSDTVSRSDVLDHCKDWLPSFMMPSDICLLESVPQLPSGKIDRTSLKSQYRPALFADETHKSALEDSIGRTIIRLLQDYTKEDVALLAPLAALGLDSLQSIRLASTLRREGFALSAIDVLSSTTVAELIANCRVRVHRKSETQDNGGPSTNGIDRAQTMQSLNGPCTPKDAGLPNGVLAVNGALTSNGIRATDPACTSNGMHPTIGVARSKADNSMNGNHRADDTDNDNHGKTTTSLPHHLYSKITQTLPCTSLQEAMLAETFVRPNAYWNWVEVEISSSCTYAEICDSLRLICQNNEILRTGFAPATSRTGTYTQLVWEQLSHSQIQQVSEFSHNHVLSTEEALLYPLRMDVRMDLESPRILFKLHHAIYDGWSFDLLLQDLHRCLGNKNLAPRPQFRDVTRYLLHGISKEECIQAKEYWTGVLHDFVPTTLPNYHGKIVYKQGLRRLYHRSQVKTSILIKRAHELGVSPQVYFQAATALILTRYTGSNDVTFGNVASGRAIPVTGVEDIIGPCIASLPCRINLEGALQVRDLLRMIQRSNRKSLQYSTFPLRDIGKAAGLEPGTRLFDVLFVWQQPLTYGSDDALTAKVIDSADDSEMKLTLEFEPRQDFVSFRATYDASTIPEQQIKYLSRQIDEAVTLFLKDTTCMVSEIDRCFTASSLSIANSNPVYKPPQHGPSHAIEEWASRDPKREAVCFGHIMDGAMHVQESITYATLNTRANQLAHSLSTYITQEDQLIGIILDKSINLYVSILAVLKLGCGYLPLVPETPTDRIHTILHDAQIKLCISWSASKATLPRNGPLKVVDIDLIDLDRWPDKNLDATYQGDHLAYAIFTSGSTGAPKGVLVTQDNLMSNLQYLAGVYPYSTGARMLQACSQAFDVSVFEIFFSWYVGMCLCTASKDDLFHDLEASIRRLQITHLSLTPTVAALVSPKNVPRVEFLVTAGEALTEHVRRQWAGRGLYQGYGPSETTNICTVRPSVTMDDLINNIGSPFDNTSAFVLDPAGDSILPRGAVGELCFGGTQVFRGYLNKPELNAIKLIDHPLYGRIYRSGDVGIMLPDNAILSVGRSDDQVKIRGQRVELGEISSAVLNDPQVRDCVTLLLPCRNSFASRSDGTTLVTFWVPIESSSKAYCVLETPERRSTISRLFELLSSKLPSYMVPLQLIPISQLPMTAQAKIDKRVLLSTFHGLTDEQLAITTAYQETSCLDLELSEWEQSVASILGTALGLPIHEMQKGTSFFSLGLDSVSAIRFCNDLRREALGDFPISTVLSNPSIARLSKIRDMHISQGALTKKLMIDLTHVFTPDQTSTIISDFETRGMRVARILPCTPLQEAMLSSTSSAPGPAYCNVMTFEVTGQLERLKESWTSMVHRHEILRTAFVPTNHPLHAFAQVVLEHPNFTWHSVPPQSSMRSHIADATSSLLSENKPPLYLALRHEGTSTKLLFGCHHALYDGSAIAVLLQEIQLLYGGTPLPPPIPYDTYLQYMLSQDLGEADQYWSTLLSGFEPSFFPNLTGKNTRSAGVSASVMHRLQIPLSEARKACQRASTSLLSVIQATWAKLLHFYTGESDVCFGNVVSGRNLPGAGMDRLVAPCFNTLPVRINFDFQQPNSDLIELTRALNIEMLTFQLTPLRRIQTRVLPDGGRLFDSLVILQQPAATLDASIWRLEQDLGDMDLPVVCEVLQDGAGDSLKLEFHYNTSLLSNTDASIIAETFDHTFLSLLRLPQAPANDTIGGPNHLRAEQNLAFQSLGSEGPFLHSGFERIAAADPDRVALDFLHPDGTRTTWSFKALNARANDIAHTLVENDVIPETIVPLHLPKSPDFYASILGVLKAGAAFAPVHPDLPEARKSLMLDELKPRLILCSEKFPIRHEGTIVIDVESVECISRDNPTISDLTTSSLAYCLFTSGSTGTPKAVSMEHCAPIQTIESSRSLVPWSPSSRLLQYAAVTFDMCYFDCFLGWTLGFGLCAAEQDDLLNDLPKVINTLNVDLLDLTPSVAVSLRRAEVPSVEWLYCIGEAMSSEVIREWGSACVNSYGPTEAAFCTTIFLGTEDTSTSVIGKPFPSTTFAIFPANGDCPLPVLSTGELYIGGAQLARGYLGKPELTDERFIYVRGQRFYKSGDIVRMLSDGNFEFVGRADDQVKIRGLRVELGEINHALLSSDPEIKTVVTQILKRDAAAKEQLVAFIVMNKPVAQEEETNVKRQLKDAVARQLPSYMVPQFLLFIEAIPRSMAGKIDKKALTTIFRDQNDETPLTSDNTSRGPAHEWTHFENQVRSIISHLSKTQIEDISPATTIYQLGLDSISAVQIATGLRKLGHTVTAVDVMRHMTCTEIAAHISRSAAKEEILTPHFDFVTFHEKQKVLVSQLYGLDPSNIAALRPCTPLQKGMVSQFIAKEGSVYMNYLRLQLDHGVDLERLKSAWAATMHRHEMLRTGFAHTKDAQHPFVMITYSPAAVRLPWVVVAKLHFIAGPEKWIQEKQQEALGTPCNPPWSLRVSHQNGENHLEIAIFHALFDAQSLQTILNDVVSEYDGQLLRPPPAVELAIEGILFTGNETRENNTSFWTALGKNASPSRFPNLSPLRQIPMSPTICTSQSAKVLAQLEQGCMSANITLQAAGISSWLTLLSAYTGETSVTCGVVLSGRTFDAAEDAVFPCINTVPFTSNTSTGPREMLQTVMSVNSQVQEHQFTPLSEIQKLVGYPSEPLFDTIFAFQKLPSRENMKSLWKLVDERATIEYPVSIEIEPKDEHLEYRLTFLPHVIPQEQALLILEQMDHLMERFIFGTDLSVDAANPDSSLYSITPAKESILPSQVSLLHGLVEQIAVEFPHRVALEFAHSIHNGQCSVRRWTYAELDTEGNRIAHLLIAHGVQPGTLVGVCFDKCPEASFAMLGILKAGCAFVAIDPNAPAARQVFVIKDSEASAVLSMSTQSTQFRSDVDTPVLNLDETATHSFPSTKPVLGRSISPQDRSYCLYTSGTTGTPKGCELTHENAVQALLSFQRLFADHWDSDSRWLQFASFHFDVSVLEQFWSWSVGICVVSAPRDLIFEDLANSINALNITHIDLTPSLAQILHPDDVPSLCKGVFITGGESLKQEILDVWGPKAVIYNGYGPTEATIGCTMYPRVPANGKPSNIGWQFDNVGSLVLKPGSDEPVLRGGIGELCVTGKLVGKGYLNRPDLTAERFPYLERFGERVYRTGDLVRILHDRSFEFLGRADDQVKLRGQRLEVGEINSVIRQSSSNITDVATLVLKHPKQQKEQLVSFLVLGKQAKRQPEVLFSNAQEFSGAKEACHDRLPPYMVPTHFVSLTNMPLNINNKADAKKLTQLFETLSAIDLQKLSDNGTEGDESWSETDKSIRRVLSEILGVNEETLGKEDSFFELGMDSISVIGVARAMKHAGFAKATASIVMKHSTIRRLAKALAKTTDASNDRMSVLAAQQAISAVQHRHRRTVARALSVDSSAIEATAPCTPLQQGMIARYLDSDSGLYFNSFQFKLNDTIDAEKLHHAWLRVSAWAQILRTVLINTEDGYVQAVLREKALSWSTHIITTGHSTTVKLDLLRQQWLSLNRDELRQPFELHMLTSPNEKLLVVHIFHGLYDGNSIELIFNSVWQAYNGMSLSDETPSFHTALAYGPLQAISGAKDFWQQHLEQSRSTPFPGKSGDGLYVTLPVTVTRKLEGLSTFDFIRRRLNVTAQAIAQACWLSVLQEYTRAAVTTGLVVSGRSIDLEGADRTIGPLFNTIPYHHRVQGSESWASMVKRVHNFNVAAHAYRHTPLRDIMKWCKRSADQPLFDTLFVYQVAQEEKEWSDNDTWKVIDGEVVADYPLALEVEQESQDVLRLTIVTQGHISDEQTSSSLLDRFEDNLYHILANPDTTVELPIDMDEEVGRDEEEDETLKNGVLQSTDFEWTYTATRLREEIASLSGVDISEVSEMTSIFELGLDSIDAIKLASKLKKSSIVLPVSSIMRGLSIARMVQGLAKADNQVQDHSSSLHLDEQRSILKRYLQQRDIDNTEVEDVLPPTPLQEAMVAEMIASKYARYYNFDVLNVNHDTDISKLRNAWSQVVETSPILRTGFIEVDDPVVNFTFAQIIHRRPHEFWSHKKINNPDFTQVFEDLRSEALETSLSTPPFRILFIEASRQSYLILAIAHALYDGWSLGLIHSDVDQAYRNQLEVRPSYEPTLAEILSTSENDAAVFWQDYLSNAKTSAFPRRSEGSDQQELQVYRHEQASTTHLEDINAFTKKSNVSLQTVGQVIFAMVLASYTKSLDVTFGSVLPGRDDEETAQLLFPTMNTVAIRTILHGTANDMIHYVQENFTSIKERQHFPLRKALSLAGVDGRLFESLFIYQKNLENVSSEAEKLYTSVEGRSDVEYPVCVEMEVVSDQLVWRCAVKEEVLSNEGAKEVLDRLDAVLRHIIQHSDVPVISITDRGTSVCGLPAFEENDTHPVDIKSDANEEVYRVSPDTQTSRAIRAVLAKVSNTPEGDITPNMTIFHMGLDSISAIKVSSLLRKEGIILSVGEMLRAGTVDKMADIVASRGTETVEDGQDYRSIILEALQHLDQPQILAHADIDAGNVSEAFPATAGQLYMISMWRNTKGGNFYPEFQYELDNYIPLETLQSSWKTLIKANPILRTVFAPTQNDCIPYMQIVLRELDTFVIDITDHDEDDIRDIVTVATSEQPWAHLFVTKRQDGWDARLRIHHALYDGVSLPLLMQQYKDICNGFPAPSPTNTFAKLIASSHTSSVLDDRKAFWTKYMRGVSNPNFPQPSTTPIAKTEVFRPALLQISNLEAVARKHGVSTQALFLASYAKLYANMTSMASNADVIIGVYLANRSLPIENITTAAIPTVNLLPLRVTSPRRRDIIALAATIQGDLQNISAPANALASLYEINDWTGIKVDTFVNFLSLPVEDDDDDELYRSNRHIGLRPRKQWQEPISRISDVEMRHDTAQTALTNERVNRVYLHAIDVEATVRNGALDVGVFAPTEMLSLENGEKLVEDLKGELAIV
ncbi:nonribosomal peptide synthetase-like protein 2 [Plenodomus tracheiphilus IPT5]|uniref:Nonribosomal peptide synthetase-like protein 2 n=1 Tax=Plenodomus tracheiphilus IPT5 TaxID=1408161 RepID=A0A6A7BDG7_9PLEO|nr:nonribosomal peptide synthetase-like protein 2 [Plenodomus tracheiphilus IPT5]